MMSWCTRKSILAQSYEDASLFCATTYQSTCEARARARRTAVVKRTSLISKLPSAYACATPGSPLEHE